MSKEPQAVEFNFDGIVGPTHNFGGLAFGDIASQQNAGSVSNPKQAAKQGLAKMRMLMELGVPQAVLPPHQRPNLKLLYKLGFRGENAQVLQQAYKYQPDLLTACYSASSMWAANAATVSPSCDTRDHKVHFTPANLISNIHRAQEAEFNHKILQMIFADPKYFSVHVPLPSLQDFSDEGAANHSVLCSDYGVPGVEVFVYGKERNTKQPLLYPARQAKLGSATIARLHDLPENKVLLLQQNPNAIDAGVFHNDVIFVANKNVLLYHTDAFSNLQILQESLLEQFGDNHYAIEITPQQLSVEEAVCTYFFNSLLVSLPDETNVMALIAPIECKNSDAVQQIITSILQADNPIQSVHYVSCDESMRNGGGPACLRLRVILTAAEQAAMHQGVILNQLLYKKLDTWIDTHYRDRLTSADLLDAKLIDEVNVALDQLTEILGLGAIYPFQN